MGFGCVQRLETRKEKSVYKKNKALLAGHMQACKRLRIVYAINFSGDAWDMGTAWAALCKRGRLSDLDSFNSSSDSEFLSE